MDYYITAGTIISNIKIPASTFDTFIENYNNNKNFYENKYEKLQSSKFDRNHKYPFGIDEMYLNSELKKYIEKKKVLCVHFYSISNFIYDNYGYLISH